MRLRGRFTNLDYDMPMTVARFLPGPLRLVDQRLDQSHRVPVGMPVKLELGEQVFVDAVIHELSNNGFRLQSQTILHEGQLLNVHMSRDVAQCEVKWVEGLNAGGCFLDAIAN